jgi:AcrR family transcriptional regulator
MSDKRSQGRPCRGVNEVGRLRIVASLQQMLRERPFDDLSRKSIAKHIGVTPALITYYFPSKQSLIEEAATPIINEYIQKIKSVLQSQSDNPTKLRHLVRTLVDCYRYDAGILKAYSDIVLNQDSSNPINHIELISTEISAFFAELVDTNVCNRYDIAALQGAIWGMCVAVARAEWLQDKHTENTEIISDDENTSLSSVFNLLDGGLTSLGIARASQLYDRSANTTSLQTQYAAFAGANVNHAKHAD